ncbi:hypothetical protein RHM58_26110 [Pseudomonas sp. 10S4]|uniref:hypothetical protein n=1 Tax=Pseudomonas sp. 10S4 TaxID=3048583 RepID=UPI002AC94D82|nr:hypothetical protein [Pseudomonas sp. 10S4]WPX17336.1 hypothetical protein RHM58_26110 [Pseudomonas sp. 10S4]
MGDFPLFIIPYGTWAQPLQKYIQTTGSAVSTKKIMEIVINWASEIKQNSQLSGVGMRQEVAGIMRNVFPHETGS